MALVLLTLIVSGLYAFWQLGQAVEYPRETKIADVTGAHVRATWSRPSGKLFRILLGTPAHSMQLKELSGTLKLFGPEGEVVFESRFDRDSLVTANWLDRQGRTSVIVDTESERLRDALEELQPVELELLLDAPPDQALELWGSWLSSRVLERNSAAPAVPIK